MAKRTEEIISLPEAQKRRKKKQKPTEPDNSALNKQVMNGDTLTIADVRQFITDAKKAQQDYRLVADRSWNEIEKRNKDGKLLGGDDLYRTRRWTRFPLWWSCLKIRQPLTLARLPEPVLKDTQGDDPFGNTACIIGERFIKSILKTFEAYPEFESGRDDFLVTNFGWGRPFYRIETCEEPEKVRLQVIQPPPPGGMPQMQAQGASGDGGQAQESPPMQQMPPIFLTPDGQEVDESQVEEDDLGPYLLTGNQVSIDNEEIYWEAGLYADLLVDPDVRKWNKATKIAFGYQYSYREFKEKFGEEALGTLKIADIEEHKQGKPILVYEYWDKFLREVRWLADNSEDFFQPKAMVEMSTESLKEVKPKAKAEGDEAEQEPALDNSDLYGLSGFFPCTEPLSINQSTKHFWPTPEFFQVSDLVDYVHESIGRMIQLSKAVRIRFFFDSSVKELATLIGENWGTGEGTGMGIPDLETTLMNNKGDLSNLVAFFPVKELLEGLETQYGNFQKGLDIFYQVTGISDLIRGQTNPDSDKTFGERQMEGKFALNRIEPYQDKIQIWIKNNYELMMEMGLKMFSDETIDEYITPQTLDDEDKQRYEPCLELLKNNKRNRFRVDFETDTTIAISQQWKQQQAIQTADIISKMLESTANVAKENPEIAKVELKLMQNVIGDLTDGKLFIDEVTESIQDAIDKYSQPQPQQPDPAAMKAQNDKDRLSFDQQKQMTADKLEDLKLQSNERIEMAKVQQQASQDNITNQLKQLQMGLDTGQSHAELSQAITKLQADIAQGWEDLNIKKENMLLVAQKEGGKANVEAFKAQIDARVRGQEINLEQASLSLQAHEAALGAADYHASLQERIATEQRLEAEHQTNITATNVDTATKLIETLKEPPAAPANASPISIDLSKTVHVKPPTPTKPKPKKSKETKNVKPKK